MAEVGGYVSLADAQLLSQSMLLAGVVPTIVKTGSILTILPTQVVKGKSLLYNRQSVQPSGQFYEIAEEWEPTDDLDLAQVEVTLGVFGDMKRFDSTAEANYKDTNDLLKVLIEETMMGLKNKIEYHFAYATTPFSGLHALTTTGQTVNSGSGTTGAAAAVSELQQAIDKVLLGNPSDQRLLMPRQLALRIDQTTLGGGATMPVMMVAPGVSDAGGMKLSPVAKTFREIEVMRSNNLTMAEAIASGTFSAEGAGATGTIFCMYLASAIKGGVFLAIGQKLFDMIGPNPSEHRYAKWMQIVSELALALGSPLGLAKLDGSTDAAMVA